MRESRLLIDARARLAKAEAAYASKEGLHDLQEGLGMLEELLEDPDEAACHSIARNVGASYLGRIYRRVAARVAAERHIPEPELEHSFHLLRAFDDTGFELPPDAAALKVEVVRRLVGLYYEGHGASAKQPVLDELAALLRDGDSR
jgi:hypothetical protein